MADLDIEKIRRVVNALVEEAKKNPSVRTDLESNFSGTLAARGLSADEIQAIQEERANPDAAQDGICIVTSCNIASIL